MSATTRQSAGRAQRRGAGRRGVYQEAVRGGYRGGGEGWAESRAPGREQAGVFVRASVTAQLEREEGVSRRIASCTRTSLPRRRQLETEPLLEQPVDGCEAERTERQLIRRRASARDRPVLKKLRASLRVARTPTGSSRSRRRAISITPPRPGRAAARRPARRAPGSARPSRATRPGQRARSRAGRALSRPARQGAMRPPAPPAWRRERGRDLVEDRREQLGRARRTTVTPRPRFRGRQARGRCGGRASPTPVSGRIVLPMPASPERRRARGPSSIPARNASGGVESVLAPDEGGRAHGDFR